MFQGEFAFRGDGSHSVASILMWSLNAATWLGGAGCKLINADPLLIAESVKFRSADICSRVTFNTVHSAFGCDHTMHAAENAQLRIGRLGLELEGDANLIACEFICADRELMQVTGQPSETDPAVAIELQYFATTRC
jgi:hypothetical protein